MTVFVSTPAMISLFLVASMVSLTVAEANFSTDLASVIVNVTNTYFKQSNRFVLDLSGNRDRDFFNLVLMGHNALVVAQEPPLPPVEVLRKVLTDKCDTCLLLPTRGQGPTPRLDWDVLRWNPGGRVLVVAECNQQRAELIIRNVWLSSRTKNIVVAAMEETSIRFYAWTPYRVGECRDVKTVDLVDEWKDGKFVRNAAIFAQNLTTLNGCELLVTATHVLPYAMNNFTEGLEVRILQLLAAHYNFTPRYVFVPPGDNFYIAKMGNDSPWEYHGAFKLLYSQQVDMAFSGISAQIDRYASSLPLYPHLVERIVWIVPTASVLSPVENAFHVFSTQLWFVILLSLAVASVAVFVTRDVRAPDYRDSFFYTLCVMINGMAPFRTRSWHLRIITMFVIVLAIHIFVAYQSSLIFLLTASILDEPYEDVEELVDGGLTCYVYSAAVRLMLQVSDASTIVPPNFQELRNIDKSFDQVAYERSAYVLFPETPSHFLLFRNYEDSKGRSLLLDLPDPFMVLPISFYMSPGSPLADLFNSKVQQIVECGIADYFSDRIQHSVDRVDKRHQVEEEQLKPLSLQHLLGAFVVLAVVLIISTLVFIAELLTAAYFRGKKNRSNKKSVQVPQSTRIYPYLE